MEQQPRTSRRLPLILAALALVVAVVGFGAAFYLYDGVGLVSDVVAKWTTPAAQPAVAPAPAVADKTLSLPSGMPAEFALRLWQEQVDSQEMIGKFVTGDVASLSVNNVDKDGDASVLSATVTLKDGSKVPGTIGMRRFGDTWYIAYASALRGGTTSKTSASSLPAVRDVSVPLLNTVVSEQLKSSEILGEYANGDVRTVSVKSAKQGPNTATVRLVISTADETYDADLIAIRQQIDGEELWFLARFNEIASTPGK